LGEVQCIAETEGRFQKKLGSPVQGRYSAGKEGIGDTGRVFLFLIRKKAKCFSTEVEKVCWRRTGSGSKEIEATGRQEEARKGGRRGTT